MRCFICMYGQNIVRNTMNGILCSHPSRENSKYLGSKEDLENYGFAPDDCPLIIMEQKSRKKLLLLESIHLQEDGTECELNLHLLTSGPPTIKELTQLLHRLGAKLKLEGNMDDGNSYQILSSLISKSGYDHKELKDLPNITTPLIYEGSVIGFISLTVIKPILPEVLLKGWREE